MGRPQFDFHTGGNHYAKTYFCATSPASRFCFAALCLAWLAMLFVLLGSTADDYFSPALEQLSEDAGLPPRFAGVTLLALGNGAPDVSSNVHLVASDAVGERAGALGALTGAGMFVTTCVAGMVMVIADGAKAKGALLRDVTAYGAASAVVWGVLAGGRGHPRGRGDAARALRPLRAGRARGGPLPPPAGRPLRPRPAERRDRARRRRGDDAHADPRRPPAAAAAPGRLVGGRGKDLDADGRAQPLLGAGPRPAGPTRRGARARGSSPQADDDDGPDATPARSVVIEGDDVAPLRSALLEAPAAPRSRRRPWRASSPSTSWRGPGRTCSRRWRTRSRRRS